ncbi:hypothetical protein JXM83_06735 [Candidatus Woesearchaeota archaeon]|nr:hypothetical protein [Candidatus Woesearchaeota archaeon]
MVAVNLKQIWKVLMTMLVVISMLASSVIAPIRLTSIVINETNTTTTPIALEPIYASGKVYNESIELTQLDALRFRGNLDELAKVDIKHNRIALVNSNISIIVNTSVFEQYRNISELQEFRIRTKDMYNVETNSIGVNSRINSRINLNKYWILINISAMNRTDIINSHIENVTINAVNLTNINERILEAYNITASNVSYSANTSKYNLTVDIENTSLEINGLEFLEDISTIKVVENLTTIHNSDTQVIMPRTKIVSAELGIVNTTITLEKFGNIDSILRCADWNGTCNSGWETTNITYSENVTHVWFNVTHFSAYIAGATAQLNIWDITEDGKTGTPVIYEFEPAGFFANYTQLDGTTINETDGTCYIEFNIEGTWTLPTIMDFDGEIWNYTRIFVRPNAYDYNVTCNGTYDELETTDDIIIDFKGIDVLKKKNIIYDPILEQYNTTIELYNQGPEDIDFLVYELIDSAMNMTSYTVVYDTNGTYGGTTYSGKYYIWNVTVSSGISEYIEYTTKPIYGYARTKWLGGIK